MTATSPRHDDLVTQPAASTPRARPRVSIVITSGISDGWLDALVSLVGGDQCAPGLEIVVVRPWLATTNAAHGAPRPPVRVVFAPPGARAPELRVCGIRQAMGDVVLLVDDDHPVAADVLDRLKCAGLLAEIADDTLDRVGRQAGAS